MRIHFQSDVLIIWTRIVCCIVLYWYRSRPNESLRSGHERSPLNLQLVVVVYCNETVLASSTRRPNANVRLVSEYKCLGCFVRVPPTRNCAIYTARASVLEV